MTLLTNLAWLENRVISSFVPRCNRLAAVILAFLWMTWASVGYGQISFQPPVDYDVGQQPGGIASGDFDGDLDNDLAVVSDGATGNLEQIEIFLNNSDGTFTASGVVFLPASSSPSELVAADFDGDVDVDLAVILRDFQQIQVVTNLGGGVFTPGGTVAVGDRAQGLTCEDYDSDLDMDLAVANRDGDSATILTNNGSAAFTSSTLTVVGEPRAVTFVDIDGNADLDVAVTNQDTRSAALFLNTGAGFSPSGSVSVGALHRPDGIVAADFDGNGTDDLAIAASDDIQPDTAVIFLNQAGSFSPGVHYATGGSNTSGILAADLDCNGSMDLITSNAVSNDLSLLPNLGGTFGAATLLPTGAGPEQMVANDLDQDSDTDIAVANRDSNTFSVLINNCATNVVIVEPNAFVVTRGRHVSGGLVELAASDNADLSIQRANADIQSRTEFEVSGISPVASPVSLEVTLESSVFARSTVVQTIELFNYTTSSWELVDTRNATRISDSTATVAATGDLSRFVEPTTLNIEARIRYQSSIARQKFASNTDQFIWTIE